jgi:Protein of unknown function (DUF3293)
MFAATARFRAAYLATHYVALTPAGPLTLCIGRRSAALDRLLASQGARVAACVTAFNPGSRPRGCSANRAAHRRLLALVRRGGWPHRPYEARDPGGVWSVEAGLLIFGLGPAQARRLGRCFRQNAIVQFRRGQAPRLVALR